MGVGYAIDIFIEKYIDGKNGLAKLFSEDETGIVPDRSAAAVCGRGDPSFAAKLVHMNISSTTVQRMRPSRSGKF